MKINTLLTLFALLFSLSARAQDIQLTITCKADRMENVKFHSKPMEQDGGAVELVFNGKKATARIPLAWDGFYNLFGIKGQSQVIAPLYLPDRKTASRLELEFDGNCPVITSDKNNRALSAFNLHLYTTGKALWEKGPQMSEEELLACFKGHLQKAEDLIREHGCDAPVQQYLRIWAYTEAWTGCENIDRISGKDRKSFHFKRSDFLPAPSEVFNSPMGLYFPPAMFILGADVPSGSLDERLGYVKETYSCPAIREKAVSAVMQGFLGSFNYELHYADGLEELKAVSEKYNLDEKYLKSFRQKRAAIKGIAFPKDVVLTDAQGNVVDFNSFKGYYVYVDMWASWCGPCCKEVPHLQQLEKELQNPLVKFVSISTDRKDTPWKAKMEALHMHGIQLRDRDTRLAEALNVQAIPFFVIYDKEGRLYLYNAPRPSSGEEIKALLEGLE